MLEMKKIKIEEIENYYHFFDSLYNSPVLHTYNFSDIVILNYEILKKEYFDRKIYEEKENEIFEEFKEIEEEVKIKEEKKVLEILSEKQNSSTLLDRIDKYGKNLNNRLEILKDKILKKEEVKEEIKKEVENEETLEIFFFPFSYIKEEKERISVFKKLKELNLINYKI